MKKVYLILASLFISLNVVAQSDSIQYPLSAFHSPLSSKDSSVTLHSTVKTIHSSLFTLYRDYQFVKRSDPWLQSTNTAALTSYHQKNMGEAELSLTRAKGGFINYYGSPDEWLTDARVESFFRLNPRMVVFGSMSYGSFDGKDMAGSAFINPERRPFDLVEDSLTNTGDKHLDTYRLTGAIAGTLFGDFSLGLRLDYTAANYAKYKDLRHQNKLMDMQLTAGFYAPLGRWGGMGAHYQYHRNTESISFGTYGKTDKTYQTLVSYAAFMGHLEQFGSTGYTDKSREMPLVKDENGVGVQLDFHPHRLPLQLFQSFTYAKGTGYYGRKSPFTITYTHHDTRRYEYSARLAYRGEGTQLSLDGVFSAEKLCNEASTYRDQLNETGATYYDYYDPVKTADKIWKNGHLALTADWDIHYQLPTWTVVAAVDWMHRQQTAYVYPFYRRQDLRNHQYSLSITRQLIGQKGVWSLTAQGAFLEGEGEPYEDLTFQTPSDKQTAPPSMDAYLYREYQYLTAPQYRLGGSVRYAFIFPTTGLKTYVQLSIAHQKANWQSDYSLGRDRTTATIALGCVF